MKLFPLLFIAGLAATAAAVITVLMNEEHTEPEPQEDSEPDMPVRKEKLEPTECIYIDFSTFEDGVSTELIKNEITRHIEKAGITIVRDKCAVCYDEAGFTGGFDATGKCRIFMSGSDLADFGSQINRLANSITAFIIHEHDTSVPKLCDVSECARWCDDTVCAAMSQYFLNYFRTSWHNIPIGRLNPDYVLPDSEADSDDAAALGAIITLDNIKGLISFTDYIKDGRLDTAGYTAAYPENSAVQWLCDNYPELL